MFPSPPACSELTALKRGSYSPTVVGACPSTRSKPSPHTRAGFSSSPGLPHVLGSLGAGGSGRKPPLRSLIPAPLSIFLTPNLSVFSSFSAIPGIAPSALLPNLSLSAALAMVRVSGVKQFAGAGKLYFHASRITRRASRISHYVLRFTLYAPPFIDFPSPICLT